MAVSFSMLSALSSVPSDQLRRIYVQRPVQIVEWHEPLRGVRGASGGMIGTQAPYVEEGDEEHIAIPVVAFADSSFPPPTVSVYEDCRHFFCLPSRRSRRARA